MIYFKPQKGKAFEKLPARNLAAFNNKLYLCSIKYDGNQIFIDKKDNRVRFFTSDWKEFNLAHIANELKANEGDFTLAGEFMHDCSGKLGDRRYSAKLTTYRTNFAKGITNLKADELKANIQIFDMPSLADRPYAERILRVEELELGSLKVVRTEIMSGAQALKKVSELTNQGWEGLMLVEPDTLYHQGKRVNHAIKLKQRKTVDLLCIGVEEGIGKCNGIGALVLKDKAGRIVKVGSGLDYAGDTRDGNKFIGKVIEIEYEQLMDTYIQPVFKAIRDKEDYD